MTRYCRCNNNTNQDIKYNMHYNKILKYTTFNPTTSPPYAHLIRLNRRRPSAWARRLLTRRQVWRVIDRGTQAVSVVADCVDAVYQLPVPAVSRVLTPAAEVLLEGAGQLALGRGGRLGEWGASRGRITRSGEQFDVVQGDVRWIRTWSDDHERWNSFVTKRVQ